MALNDKKPITTKVSKEHGIGAIVERKYTNNTHHDSDCTVQNVIFSTTIKISNNKFGEQFVSDFAKRESRGVKVGMWTLNGVLLVAQPETSAGTFAVWVYTTIENYLPRILWMIEGYQAISFKYDPFNLYQVGGKIEDKLSIISKQYKDGHVYDKITGSYSVWGKKPIPTVEKYYDREGVV